jgi:hypothetical protein
MAQTVDSPTRPSDSAAELPPVAPDPGSALPAAGETAGPSTPPARVGTRAPGPAGEPWTNGRPRDPEAIRQDIQRTRSRMSDTLDALEAELVREKEALVRTVTLKPVREKLKRQPWKSMAIAFAAGYIIAAIRD